MWELWGVDAAMGLAHGTARLQTTHAAPCSHQIIADLPRQFLLDLEPPGKVLRHDVLRQAGGAPVGQQDADDGGAPAAVGARTGRHLIGPVTIGSSRAWALSIGMAGVRNTAR